MKQYIPGFMIAILLASTLPTAGLAQAPAPAPAPTPAPVPTPTKPSTPLKVQVVISRYEGDKKVSSLPYILSVTANEARGGSVRMGSQVPVPQGNQGYSYQNVGTNIDCTATSVDDNRFKVEVSISDSSVMERRSPDAPPTLRNFTTNNSVILRDGQTAQFTAAADKNTGEVVKVDVTLMVEK